MIKKAIFGGTFDPIHNGHLHIAYEALYKLKLDKIVFMPAGTPPHKIGTVITDAVHRYEMVKSAIKKEKCFEIDNYEILKNSYSYTFETVEHVKKKENETEWYFIGGMDCLIEIENWKNVDRILDLCTLVVFERPGYALKDAMKEKEVLEKKYNKKIIFLEIPLMDISSSAIRNKIKSGEDVSYLLPNEVYSYICSKNLYR